LKNPEEINLFDFFLDLANISYIGDIRTYLKAEKSNKMRNTVLGGFNYYLDLYSANFEKIGHNLLKYFDPNDTYSENTKIELKLSDNIKRDLYRDIPKKFMNSLIGRQSLNSLNPSNFNEKKFEENFLFKMTYKERKEVIDSYLKSSNLRISVFNLASAKYSTNFTKSFSYIYEKYRKSLIS
jgi:hypothetical protein